MVPLNTVRVTSQAHEAFSARASEHDVKQFETGNGQDAEAIHLALGCIHLFKNDESKWPMSTDAKRVQECARSASRTNQVPRDH